MVTQMSCERCRNCECRKNVRKLAFPLSGHDPSNHKNTNEAHIIYGMRDGIVRRLGDSETNSEVNPNERDRGP